MDAIIPQTTPFVFDKKNTPTKTLLALYEKLVLTRTIEKRMQLQIQQGKISKWFSSMGQEAISIGVTMALTKQEFILPMHRNLGVFTAREVPLDRLFIQCKGGLAGYTKGRDRSFHFYAKHQRIIGMISHIGPQLNIANGIALADMLENKNKVTAVFTGEAGTSEGDFHEALNIASVWQLPVLFCIENNGFGISTPTQEQYRVKNLADRALGYGMESKIISGNNILEIYQEIAEITASMREHPRPVLIEFKTFRIRPHEESSAGKTTDNAKEIAYWEQRDPLLCYTAFLEQTGLLCDTLKEEINLRAQKQVQKALEKAEIALKKPVRSTIEEELNDVYAAFSIPKSKQTTTGKTKKMRFIDAIQHTLYQELEKDENLILLGQDIAAYGGVFKATKGLVDRFGKDRVRNTPICESGIISTAMGLVYNGKKAVVELQFSDFISTGFTPVVQYLAKIHYRCGQNADIVLRMPCGAGVGAGPFHSQTNEAWFLKTPGLKVVYPSSVYDAKGLLATAIADPNPVLFFEHKELYRTLTQEIPEHSYTIPFGKASVLREGNQICVLCYGSAVHWVLETLNEKPHISAEIIDLRTLQPLDTKTIFASVKKTGKVLIVQEDTLFGGFASEISAQIMENCFTYLDAPVQRIASLDTPIPFNSTLEKQYLPKERLKKALETLFKY